ncbi:hypothetical protein PTKIN_Ptkin10aG0145700 [Pterospermum kingtungense]
MNRVLPEMLQCLDMTVLERQRARLKWQQEQQFQQQQQSYFSELSGVFSSQASHVQGFQGGLMSGDSVYGGDQMVMTRLVKPDPGVETAWPELGSAMEFGPCGYGNGPTFDVNYAISRTSSCPPAVAAAAAAVPTEAVEVKAKAKAKDSLVSDKMGSAVTRENLKKRKADKLQNSKVAAEDDDSKRIKAFAEDGESKITGPNTNKKKKKENPADTSKENSKVTNDVQKPDYIHVRARRGQATDSHSLAERLRREKISERMKYLQDLVPGCNKITGKAGMLDEIINYVQSLQRQVEFLSMKLAAVNPMLDSNIDNLFAKEAFPSCTANNFPAVGMSSEMANNPPYLQLNQVQQVVPCSGLEMGMNSIDMALRRTISAPVSIPDGSFIDSSCFTQQIQPSATIWDVELLNLYNVAFDQGRSTPFPSQPFTGSIAGSDLKMEM